MSNITYLTSLVSSLAERLNQIEANAKRIFELPQQTPVSGASKFAVSRPLQLPLTGEVTEYMTLDEIVAYIGVTPGGFAPTITDPQTGDVIQYVDGIWVNSSLDLNGDRFTVIQPIDVTGLDITLPIGFKWVINGVEYENTSAFLQTIALSSTGTERGDIFVANENNTFDYIQGIEDVANVVYPQTPPNKLFLTSIKVNDSSISTPIDPELGADYIPKENPSLIAVTGVGNNAMAGGVVTDKARYIDFSTYFGSGNVLGLNSDASVFIGQDIRIKNNTGAPVPLSHNAGTDLKFIFPDGLTYTMQPNEIATFRLRNTTTKEIDFVASNLGTPTADQVSYDNTSSGLLAETVQEMGDEIVENISKVGFVQRTGTAIVFDKWATYGTYATPESGNLSYSFTNMVKGMIQVMYHEDTIAPTLTDTGVTVIETGDYVVENINKITVHCIDENVVEVNIKAL